MNRSILNAMKIAALVLFAMWATSTATEKMADKVYAKHEKRVLEFAHRKEVLADSLQEIADSLSFERDSLAIVANMRHAPLPARIAAVRELPVRDTAIVAELNAIIDVQEVVIADQKQAIAQSIQIEAKLRGSITHLEEANDSLVAQINRPKPKPSRWSIGATAGMCVGVNGTQAYNGPCISFGVSWKVL